MRCSLCNYKLTVQKWVMRDTLPDMADDSALCTACWLYAKDQLFIDGELERYGYSHDDDGFIMDILQAALGMRQVFQGLAKTCMMDSEPEGEEMMKWCDKKKGKHSCYCPAFTALQILEFTKWLEGK